MSPYRDVYRVWFRTEHHAFRLEDIRYITLTDRTDTNRYMLKFMDGSGLYIAESLAKEIMECL